jgi:hypothetical protein
MAPLSPLSFHKHKDGSFTVIERKSLEKQVIKDLPAFLSTYLNSHKLTSDQLIELKKNVRPYSDPTPKSRVVRAIIGASSSHDPIRIIDEKLREVLAAEGEDAYRQHKLFGESTIQIVYFKEGAIDENLGTFPLDSHIPQRKTSPAPREKKSPPPEAKILKVFKSTAPKLCPLKKPQDSRVARYIYRNMAETLRSLIEKVRENEIYPEELLYEFGVHLYVNLLKNRFETHTLDKELFVISLGEAAKGLSSPIVHRRVLDMPTALPLEDPEVQNLIDAFNSGEWKEEEERVLKIDHFPEEYHDLVYKNLLELLTSKKFNTLFEAFANSFPSL